MSNRVVQGSQHETIKPHFWCGTVRLLLNDRQLEEFGGPHKRLCAGCKSSLAGFWYFEFGQQ